jgi:NDP-sugar pyrophosphorylase family protein
MKAIILAAGAGTRLRPLTDTCPKPMLPIAGRPLLSYTLAWLRAYGVVDVALNLHHLPHVVRSGLGDGSAYDMELRYSYEPALLGTAGAVRAIAERFHGWLDQQVVIVYGDMLLDFDLAALARVHAARGALLTLALKHTQVTHTQGMVTLGARGRVLHFAEKPAAWHGDRLASAGVYMCDPRIVPLIPPGASDFGHDLIPALLERGAPVYACRLPGTLLDIGTHEAYAQAQLIAAERDWRARH